MIVEFRTEQEILNFERDINVIPVKWLWYPYIPLGKITIMQGSAGVGKTMLVLNIAAALSRGDMLPGDEFSREPINIIYNTAEDGLGDTIKPRLIAASADCAYINTINERVNTITMTDERLENNVRATGAKLIILDPIQAYLGANIDMNKANEVRPIFAHLGRMAEDNECAVILIGHQGKNQTYNELQSLLGSTDQGAAARSVLTVTPHPNDKSMLLINHTKSSLAPKGKSLAFKIDDGGKIEWGDFVEINNGTCEVGITKFEAAKDFLTKVLADGAKPQSEIQDAAKEQGICMRTLYKAKAELGISSHKVKNFWVWEL